ncbi:uncharacterized protein LOC143975853 [Lithobates pipiens]
MHLDDILYLSLLATDDRDFCRQTLGEYTREQLLECIRIAHVFVDQGSFLFEDVQPLIWICTELALSDASSGGDDYTPPFSAAQVESLVWLLEDDSPFFFEQYSACPKQVLAACIDSVQSLVRQTVCKPDFVQPLLQAWSSLLYSASVSSQPPISVSRYQPAGISSSLLPPTTTISDPYTLLPMKYQYPVSSCCTYPAFNPSATSQLPSSVPLNLPSSSAPSVLPSFHSSLLPAASTTYSPVPTYKSSVAKTKKKRKFFPTHTILSSPTSASAPDVPMPAVQPVVPVSLPAVQPAAPAYQPDAFQPAAPAYQPDAFQPAAPAYQPDAFQPAAPAFQPDAFQPAAPVPDALLLNTVQATKPMPNILRKLSGTSYSELTQCTQEDSLTPTGHLSTWITDSKEEIAGVLVDASLMEVKPYLKG